MPIISARFANLLREIFADTYKGMMNARDVDRDVDRVGGRRNVIGKKL